MNNAMIQVNRKSMFLGQGGGNGNKQAAYLCSKLMHVECSEQLMEFFDSELSKSIFGESVACMLVSKQEQRVLELINIGADQVMADLWGQENLRKFCKEASSDKHALLRGYVVPNRVVLTHGFSLRYENQGSLLLISTTAAGRDFATWRLIKLLLPYIFSAQKSIYHQKSQAVNDCAKLSSREAEIMKWIAMGKTNSEVATILGVSAFTVKNHMANILAKLEVCNRVQAIGRAKAYGYLK